MSTRFPSCKTDPGDRNRTSPFAFTGNRFEFRAPGSSQTIAGPMVVINTILAESLDFLATELESAIAEGSDLNAAIQTVLEQVMALHGSVIFNGDGYSDDWQVEAQSRGLPNLRTTVDALPELASAEAKELFAHYGVLNNRELHSRLDVALEQYVLSVGVEARSTLEIAKTIIFPTAMRYQTELATNAASLIALGYEYDKRLLDQVTALIGELGDGIAALEDALAQDHEAPLFDEARLFCDVVVPATLVVRHASDELETLVADDLWPLASYQEMLFIL